MNGPKSLQFVDTNVLNFAHDVSAGQKHIRARELIQGLWRTGQGCRSVQVLQEFYVNVTLKVAHPLPAGEAAQIDSDLSAWEVHSPRPQDVLSGMRLQQRYRVSFWDVMAIASACQLGCRVLWSEDLSAGRCTIRWRSRLLSEGRPAQGTLGRSRP